MADDKTKGGQADRERINVNEPTWLGVSEEAVRQAIKAARGAALVLWAMRTRN
jgi:hypothetical protein